jgi:hypothetical protein
MLRFSGPLFTAVASASAIVGTISLVGLAAFLLSGTDNAKAETATEVVVDQTYGKGDRMPVLKKGPDCSLHAWPYYEPSCQYDMRRASSEMPAVRIIAIR